MYVLKRKEDGKYVAQSGSEHSYTKKLEKARVFTTRDLAEKDACGNEQVIPVSDILKGS